MVLLNRLSLETSFINSYDDIIIESRAVQSKKGY